MIWTGQNVHRPKNQPGGHQLHPAAPHRHVLLAVCAQNAGVAFGDSRQMREHRLCIAQVLCWDQQ